MNSFFKSKYTVEDLEQFRDENGFIDLSKAGIEFTAETREEMGNANRVKNWVDFNGTKALVKEELILEDERNYGIYAELIIEEIAKQLGIENAHYDLIKFCDEKGEYRFGVLSESVIDLESEQLVTLHDIIGDEPIEESDFIDTTSYGFTVEKLEQALLKDGYSEEQVESVVTEYKKRLVFGLSVLETDKHTENIAFVRTKVDGKDEIRISPNYDSESSLMLEYDIPTVKKLLDDYVGLEESVKQAHPRIGTLQRIEDGGFESFWMDTLEALCEDDEIYDYYIDTISQKIDIDAVLENVEKRIKAKLPEEVRLLAKYAYKIRNKAMEKVMNGQMEVEDQMDINSLLSALVQRGYKQDKIRTSEQMQTANQMLQSIKDETKQKDPENIGKER